VGIEKVRERRIFGGTVTAYGPISILVGMLAKTKSSFVKKDKIKLKCALTNPKLIKVPPRRPLGAMGGN
jgi:hypothetical protein